MAITGTGSIRQKQSPNGKPLGSGYDRSGPVFDLVSAIH